jgi:hypothetical protein
MREFDDKTSWEGGRADVLYTVAVLEAADVHDKLKRAVALQLERWNTVEKTRRAADDAVVSANASVAWADHLLDGAVRAFANELLRDVGGDASRRSFAAFFPEAPNEIIRMGLEAEVERCERFAAVAAKVTLSKNAAAKLAAVNDAIALGRTALVRRRDAFTARAQAALDVASWKESSNATRNSVHVQLQTWAIEHEQERAYADRFFPTRTASRRKEAKGDNDARGGDPTPT